MLLLGLAYMKTSVESAQGAIDVARMAAYPPIVYVLVGVVFAALIHSSSAVVMIALSALSAGLIRMDGAAALVIGADLGTTSTALVGAVGGTPEKKRVALAHFVVNVATLAVGLPLVRPLPALLAWVGVNDPLYGLVAFHSSLNVLSILLFLPFLKPFSRFLEARFHEPPRGVSQFIPRVPTSVPESALDALDLETTHLLSRVMRHNLAPFDSGIPFEPPVILERVQRPWLAARSALDEYDNLKLLEGEILAYGTELQREPLQKEAATRVASEVAAARYALQSAKGIKDIRHNLTAYLRGASDRVDGIHQLGAGLAAIYRELTDLWRIEDDGVRFERLAALTAKNHERYESGLQTVHRGLADETLEPRDVSTELNINREVYASTKALIEAVGRHLLAAQTAEHLDALPSGDL
jgi:phosphate:Na+ symporter